MTATTLLRCAACSSPFKVDDLDLARGLAKCSYCQAAMTLATPAGSTSAFKPRPEVPLPPRVRVQRTEAGVEIERRWYTHALWLLVVFCVVWDAILFVWYSVVLAKDGPWPMALFPIAHLSAGVFLTYLALAGLFNSTRITLGRGVLRVRHGPFPWPGGRELQRNRIEQIFCKERHHRGRRSETISYEVWMVLRDGTQAKLLGTTTLGIDQALFIEQHIERTLGIADRDVPGELQR